MEETRLKRKKGKPIGCLILVIFLMVLFTTMAQKLGETTKNTNTKNQEEIITLKDETFSMYVDVYNINTNMVKGLEAVVNGNLSSVDYYDSLKGIKEHSLNRVKFIEQKSKKIKDDKIIENLEPYSAIYTKFLMISDNMINNMENPSVEILSKTKELVEEVNILIEYIEDERLNLLTNLGINEKEIEEILKNESQNKIIIKEKDIE